jgi:5-(carboxyamino)imidazole ribonucleotide mutase
MSQRVLILMGSDSDLDVMTAAVKCLRDFDVGCDVQVCSVHRSPDKALGLARSAKDEGIGVIIAGAGGAAHLAGALAAKSTLPVIGVPIANGALHGVDALYATVQMPPGVPVATVAVNGAHNAALLAVQILATGDEQLADAFAKYKDGLVGQVEAKNQRAQKRLSDEGLV